MSVQTKLELNKQYGRYSYSLCSWCTHRALATHVITHIPEHTVETIHLCEQHTQEATTDLPETYAYPLYTDLETIAEPANGQWTIKLLEYANSKGVPYPVSGEIGRAHV